MNKQMSNRMSLSLSDWLNKIHSRLQFWIPRHYGRLSPRLIDRLTTYFLGILTIVDSHLYDKSKFNILPMDHSSYCLMTISTLEKRYQNLCIYDVRFWTMQQQCCIIISNNNTHTFQKTCMLFQHIFYKYKVIWIGILEFLYKNHPPGHHGGCSSNHPPQHCLC